MRLRVAMVYALALNAQESLSVLEKMSTIGELEKGFVPFSMVEGMPSKWLYIQTFFFLCQIIYAAGLPYASCSIWLALSTMCKSATLQDKSILICEGTSEIGALAIQYAKYKGLRVIVSTESKENFAICYHYGADLCISNTEKHFVNLIISHNYGRGVDFVLDYGASNLRRNIKCCANAGKVLIVNLHGMKSNGINLTYLMRMHIQVKVVDVRSKSLEYKASLIRELLAHLWPAILQQKVVPVIHQRFSMKDASKAHDLLKKNHNVGKIILHNDFGMKKMDDKEYYNITEAAE